MAAFPQEAIRGKRSLSDKSLNGVVRQLFPEGRVLLPQIRQVYELDLAYGESLQLSNEELIHRGAYFQSVDGFETNHFRICMNTPEQVNASARQDRKNFFASNVFAVGYATHGLFPYRGKFHPQMIKAVINLMGLKPGSTILDPMAGCGTTGIEASLMGIDSICIELSPFACLMANAKTGVLEAECSNFQNLLSYADDIYLRLAPYGPHSVQRRLFNEVEISEDPLDLTTKFPKLSRPIRELLLLCYLDAVGYSSRRKNKTARQLFPDLMQRYLSAVERFNETRELLMLSLGKALILQGDARHLDISDESVDGVLFSPPYSFAIDYVENDRPQLEMLGVDVKQLKAGMVGLNGEGRTKEELIRSRLETYFTDMERIMIECKRVLKPEAFCVIVVGSNINQTGGISLEDGLISIGEKIRMPLEFQIMREIEGIRNTMRDEYLLFFRKPNEV